MSWALRRANRESKGISSFGWKNGILFTHIYILSLQLIPKATESCVVFLSTNLSPILYQANPYGQPSCKLDKRVEKPPDSHGHIQ